MRLAIAPMLRRHRGEQVAFAWTLLLIAVLFYARAVTTDEYVMPPGVYGEWVTSFPAEWWALSLMGASAAWIVGIVINGHWRWSPCLRLLGTGWHIVTLALFVFGAADAGADFMILLSLGAACAVAVMFGWAMIDVWHAVRGGEWTR